MALRFQLRANFAHLQKLCGAAIVVTFVGTVVAVPPPNVDNNDCQHQDPFDSTLR